MNEKFFMCKEPYDDWDEENECILSMRNASDDTQLNS